MMRTDHPIADRNRELALNAIAHVLGKAEREGRDPDEWECHFLSCSFRALSSAEYTLALVEADNAAIPFQQRLTQWLPDATVIEGFDLATAKEHLAAARQQKSS